MQKWSFSLTASFRVFYMRLTLLGFCFLYFSLLAGTQAECPVQINPQRVVVRYGDSVAVNCNTSVQHQGIGWEASEGAVPKNKTLNLITWRVSELTQWDIKPFCYINYQIGEDPCQVELPVTVYKTPDSVSISTYHRGPMKEGEQYELQCDVHNVAPVQNLTVKWYKGQTLLNQTTFTDTIETPVNKTVTLLIRPDRADDGAQYRCEAELDLGEEGPQPPPTNSSDPLSITVYSKPIINETKLPSVVHVFRGYPEELVCEAEGNPKPTIIWQSNGKVLSTLEKLKITESAPEYLNCTANNSAGSTTRQVQVSIQDISIRFTVNPEGPMIVGKQYELQCLIQNMDPSKNVAVRWYKLTQTNSTDTIKTLVSNTSKLLISPNKNDDGAQYSCEAEGPHGYPPMSSGKLNITVHYISISFVNHSGPMIVGKQYELQCLIQNVDPSKNVAVRWYKLTQTNSTDTNRTLVSNTSKLPISPNKNDDGAQYSCETEGPHGYPPMSSGNFNITVHYEPIINEIKLPSTVPVFRGYPEVLVCEAEGNPKPTISWSLGANNTTRIIHSEKLNITESTPEDVYCTASNSAGRATRRVKVVLKEDYLPLIAGLIAVIVAFVSVIFIFIYSIYYKTAKMGHYSLKDAKPCAQNGDIAQNGQHNPIPMKKLSQSNILA